MSDSSSDRPDVFASETVRGSSPPPSLPRDAAPRYAAPRTAALPQGVTGIHRPERYGSTTLPARPHACRRYLKVRVQEAHYGVPASQVREIVYCPEISESVADGPRGCAMANLRGHIVPVVDGARLVLGDDRCRADLSPTCLVVLEMSSGGDAQRVIGLLVDGTDEVVQVHESPVPADTGSRDVNSGSLRSLEPLLRDFLAG